MNGSQLKALRIQRKLTQIQLAEFLGVPNNSTISRWESETHEVPPWVADKMFSGTTLSLPLPEMQNLLNFATQQKLSFEQLLAEALRAYLKAPKVLPPPAASSYIPDADSPPAEPKIADERTN